LLNTDSHRVSVYVVTITSPCFRNHRY